MSDRIEQLRQEQKEWLRMNGGWPRSGSRHAEAEAALTEALDIADNTEVERAKLGAARAGLLRDHKVMREHIAEQERLLKRARELMTDHRPNDSPNDLVARVQQFLSDLDARSGK